MAASAEDIGQLLMCGIPRPTLDDATRALIQDVQPAGFVLFSRNLETPEQTRCLTDELRAVSKLEPLIAIDEEGGRVSRLKEFGHASPSAGTIGVNGEAKATETIAGLTGNILRNLGFNLNFAPVLDIENKASATHVLDQRCYGNTPEIVTLHAGAFIRGLKKAGIIGCAKHFPGLGAAHTDPHLDLPRIERGLQELRAHEMAPYIGLCDELDLVMSSHALYPNASTDDLPATLSRNLMKGLLREGMNYAGTIITDDLEMGAIVDHYGFEDTVQLALKAGNDLLMFCHSAERLREAKNILKRQKLHRLERALSNVAQLKEKLSTPTPFNAEKIKQWLGARAEHADPAQHQTTSPVMDM